MGRIINCVFFKIIIVTITTTITIVATSQHEVFTGFSFSESEFHLEFRRQRDQSIIQNSSDYTSCS